MRKQLRWVSVARDFSGSTLFALFLLAPLLSAQAQTGQRISATRAFNAGCSSNQLGGITLSFPLVGSTTVPSPARLDPEWAAIISDPGKSILQQPPQIVEGFVPLAPDNERDTDQSHAEVAEEDISWTHYAHDFTFKVVPDRAYEKVLTYYTNTDGTIGLQPDMEVEWDNASLMDEHEGFQRIWGSAPEFVWPGIGDRIWVLGRWIFDCGHPGDSNPANVRYETEIHPPRALVTQRLYHPALDSFPVARVSAPNFPGTQSYLPVTGVPQAGTTAFPTQVPLTEADIFVSGNAGGANDLCSLVPANFGSGGEPNWPDGIINPFPDGSCGSGHTSPVIAVNDRNYVFDIYPPLTDYQAQDMTGAATVINGNTVHPFTVYPPVPDASLQYRIVDHSSELPKHACGGDDTSGCVTVTPIICLIDNTTPPPDQSETSCPTVPARPTRLRVILPFKGTNANYFAQSILLGWDDVPTIDNNTIPVRTFKVTLHKLTVNDNGEGCCTDGDWRVFVSVGGQWRYISPYFDTDANGGTGIKAINGGDNKCSGDALTENGNNNCFYFDNTPWIVSIGQQEPIHVAVGGFIARDVEDGSSPIGMCRNYPGGCDPNFSLGAFLDLFLGNDDRIGTYEFDLTNYGDYQRPNTYETAQFGCTIFSLTGCSIRYTTDFSVEEIPAGTPPVSSPLVIGTPSYSSPAGTYISSATNLIPQTAGSSVEGFQYRFHQQGGPLPNYTSTLTFPVHWTHAGLAPGGHSVNVYLTGTNLPDGPYDFQYSAENFAELLEPRHTKTVILDNSPPVTTFTQPTPSQYGHGDSLTLNYNVSDGAGSGVKSFTPRMDGLTASQFGASLNSGQTIYLYSMPLGTHTFSVDSIDNVNNAGTNSVTFTITVTFNSLGGDVKDLTSLGCITNISQSLLAKISAGQNLFSKGQIQATINTLSALIDESQAQGGNHISTTCTDPNGRTFNPLQVLIGDAQYLLTSFASQLKPDPIVGTVVNSSGVPVSGAAVNLMSSSKTVVATVLTGSDGFYYFADPTGLASGSTYTMNVSVPKGYKSSTPPSPAFTWSGNPVVQNFALN